jgi:flavin-dependent dehydrogenase
VTIAEETRIDDVRFDGAFELGFKSQKTTAKVCCAAYGKRSNLDIKWKRSFSANANKRLNNYVGVKYHIQTDWPKNIIGLHNFSNGYCGISKIEENNYCLCFMTKADNLRKSFNNIDQLQNEILCRNPHLSKIFSNSDFSSEFPVTISQISFQKKTQVENHVLMIGDAGGMITPLCGNGMSIALHTAKIAAALADDFLCGRISRDQLENFYKSQWTHHFSKRLRSGRILQQFFGSDRLSNLFVSTFRKFPFLSKPIIKMTHGKPF